ncbi:4-(cytidine 5'-diphospho)-2-C-methyl-D-erythritol kinase [Methylomonas sp. SURF-2]|uniref:4-diphosphocytidyl-2-C-methyl-D-erythritol kinase n=1 Tax=Methylomonas subterranea TaxID=2952225 RepID=A0ABT1TLB1_9GAMM|nr:4-(cytidine 5'-diphospho)-2-C-methyl-D-erythritol kinase [Methylomonas sp. SURF-2]MCQ8106270.1 4-(cytidine 5'-diphospho)-2-C-methyl-D-erythritol kinase [Methylomonas sp. SURF-2]
MGIVVMEAIGNVPGWGEKWPAPAKLNLMLRITGRRADGYHLLQTVFQMLDLCDWLTFHPAADGRVSLAMPIPGVAEAEDLTVRAANLLKSHTGCEAGVIIEVEKNLPMGGGLGGGSSDAATTLVVLNHLWGLNLSKQELMALGLQLGADVPVFVFGHSAWAEGVGEDLRAIEIPESWVVIIKPDCHVNTGEIFRSDGLTRNSESITMSDFLAGEDRNDCTQEVCRVYRPVKDAIDALSVYSNARLTGTGACVFAQFSEKELALSACQSLKDDWSVFLARGLNTSPLYGKLEKV